MSDKIQRSVHYYNVVANKHERSGRGPTQLAVHKEIAEMVVTCNSLEEIQQRMKSEGLEEKPAQALIMDKMKNLADAARDNDLPEIAELYNARFEEVKADYQKAYETGWEQKVQDVWSKINTNASILNDLVGLYTECMLLIPEHNDYPGRIDKIKETASELKLGMSMQEVFDRPYMRKHISLNDDQYAKFRSFILDVLSGNEPKPTEDYDTRSSEVLSFVKENKSKMKETGNAFNQKSKRRGVLYIAPEEPGPYSKEVMYESES